MNVEDILKLDMRAQTISLKAWVEVSWQSSWASWDTDVYSFKHVFLPASKVWRPSLAIYNLLLPSDQFMKLDMDIKVGAGSLFRWFPGGIFDVTCKVNIKLYPFDTQTCNLLLGLWSMGVEDANGTEAQMDHTVRNDGQREVVMVSARRTVARNVGGNTFWYLDFALTLKRKWSFYALNVVMPVVLVSTLNRVMLALPVGCGERLSVSVITFLTLAVFMTLVQDNCPTTPTPSATWASTWPRK